MRNLKRVLSLTLALVMMLSLMVVNAGAAEVTKVDFTDADEITYTEAVDLMTALGVIQGTDKGNFDPAGSLTREAAAKIVCYMLLGPENAEKLTTNTSIFTDVAAGRWSAGYIAYCANLDILAGTGDGSFNPEGALTGVAFGKMLLIALGYDPAIQGYVGNNWATAIATDMLDAGIDVKGTTLSDPLTREQAAQMAFQTLEADMVRYTNKGTTVNTSDGTSVVVGASEPTAIAAVGDQNYNGAADDSHDQVYQQFCEKYFDKLEKKSLAEGDELGRPGYDWVYDSEKIGTFSDDAKYTLKDEFTGKDLYNTVGKTATGVDYTWAVYVDGADDTLTASDVKTNAANKDTATKYAGNGAVAEIFVDSDAKEVTVCIINTYGGKIDKVYTEDDVKDDEKPYVTVDGIDFETVAFEEDDVVLYTKGLDDDDAPVIVTMTLAEEIEGEVTKVTTDKNFTVDGTTYKYNVTFSDSKVGTSSVDKEVLFYVDAEGYVVKIGEAKSSNDYAIVIAVGIEDDRYDSSKHTYYAKLLLTDNTIVAAELDEVPKSIADEAALIDAYLNKIVSYTENDGKYELSAKSDAASAKNDLAIISGKATFAGPAGTVNTNNNTVFLVCNDADDEDYSVYVGYKNVPDINGKAGTKIAVYAEPGKPAKVVYVEGADVESSGTTDVIFIRADKNASVVKESGKEYREFDAVVDGKATKIQVAESALGVDAACEDLIDAGNHGDIIAVKSLSYNSKDLVTKYTVYDASNGTNTGYVEATGTVKVADGVVGFGGETYGWADDVIVAKYDADAKTKLTISSITGIKTDSNDEVVLVLDKNTVIGVFITVVPGNPDPTPAHTHNYTWSTLDAVDGTHQIGEHKGVCDNADGLCNAETVYHDAAATGDWQGLDGAKHYKACSGGDGDCDQHVDEADHDCTNSYEQTDTTAGSEKHTGSCECGKTGTEEACVDAKDADGNAGTDGKCDVCGENKT